MKQPGPGYLTYSFPTYQHQCISSRRSDCLKTIKIARTVPSCRLQVTAHRYIASVLRDHLPMKPAIAYGRTYRASLCFSRAVLCAKNVRDLLFTGPKFNLGHPLQQYCGHSLTHRVWWNHFRMVGCLSNQPVV